MNVVLAGGESAGLLAFNALVRTAHRVVAVLASPPKSGFAGASLAGVAENLSVPVMPTTRVRDPEFGAVLRAVSADLILNVHSLNVICPEVLQAPRIGSFNLHPGPLPEYAGLSSPSWAIHLGESSHAVTLHWMVPTIDAGPIAYCEHFPIEETDTGLSLALKCVKFGLPLVEMLLRVATLNPDAIPRIPQDLRKRRYFGAAAPDQGRLSWEMPAQQVLNLLRASDWRPFRGPWPHPRTRIGTREIGIVSARRTGRATNDSPGTVGRMTQEGVEVACADEWLLVELVEENGKYEKASVAMTSVERLCPAA